MKKLRELMGFLSGRSASMMIFNRGFGRKNRIWRIIYGQKHFLSIRSLPVG